MLRMNKKDINRPYTSPPRRSCVSERGESPSDSAAISTFPVLLSLLGIHPTLLHPAQGDWQAELCLPSPSSLSHSVRFRPSKRQPPFVLYCHSLLLPFWIVQRLNPFEVRFALLFQIALNSIGRRPFFSTVPEVSFVARSTYRKLSLPQGGRVAAQFMPPSLLFMRCCKMKFERGLSITRARGRERVNLGGEENIRKQGYGPFTYDVCRNLGVFVWPPSPPLSHSCKLSVLSAAFEPTPLLLHCGRHI